MSGSRPPQCRSCGQVTDRHVQNRVVNVGRLVVCLSSLLDASQFGGEIADERVLAVLDDVIGRVEAARSSVDIA